LNADKGNLGSSKLCKLTERSTGAVLWKYCWEEWRNLWGLEVCEFTLSAESWQSCTASRKWCYKAQRGDTKGFFLNNSDSELMKIQLGLIVLPTLG